MISIPVVVLVSLVFLLPAVACILVGLRADQPAWEIGLAIPRALAIDILSILVLSRLFTMETAVLVMRGLWAAYLVVFGARAKKFSLGALKRDWPESLGVRQVFPIGVAIAIALMFFSQVSWTCAVWDRPWHSPLVSSMLGQRAPFVNVYQPSQPLRYHLTGDVCAGAFRALSGNAISADGALAAAHDVVLVAMIASTMLVLIAFGVRRPWRLVLTGLAPVFLGTVPLRGGIGPVMQAYGYYPFFTLSYRPHVALSALLMVGFLAAVAVRAEAMDGSWRGWASLSTIFMTAACLALTDECSLGLIGIGLGAAWLVHPAMIAKTRARGVVVLIGLAVAILSVHFCLGGSFGTGGPVQSLGWATYASAPGVGSFPSLPLVMTEGRRAAFLDLFPGIACVAALAALCVARPSRGLASMALFCMVVVTSGWTLGAFLTVNAQRSELERLYFAPLFAATLFVLFQTARLRSGSLAHLAFLLGVGVPAIFTLTWISEVQPTFMALYKEGPDNQWARDKAILVNCRKAAGAHLGDAPRPTYVDASRHHLFTACRGIYGPGRTQGWSLMTLPQYESVPQWSDLKDKFLGPHDPLDVICSRDKSLPPDAVCSLVLQRTACTPEGRAFVRCPVSAADRNEITALLLRPTAELGPP